MEDANTHDPIERSVLFSMDGNIAREVTRSPRLEFTSQVPPLFPNTRVTKEIPIMVEGVYTILDPVTKQWQKVEITKEDIERYFKNISRDVAVNYEHRRGDKPKGWVRLKDTARVGILETSHGPATALFANLELYEPTVADVEQGYFRDVSIELKPHFGEITGLALTSVPIMRDLQFYSQAPEATEQLEEGTAVPDEGVALEGAPDTGTPLQESLSFGGSSNGEPAQAIPAQEKSMTDADKQAVLAETLQEFGLTVEDLRELPSLIQDARRARQEARLVLAKEKVKAMTTTDQGGLKLTPTGIEAAAHLLLFAQDHAELQFSVEGESRNPEQLIEQLFASIEAVQVFGQLATESLGVPEPVQTDPYEAVNTERVTSIVERMKSAAKAAEARRQLGTSA